MTAVPDPRFRDQLAEALTWRTELWNRLSDLLGQHGPTIDSIDDEEHDELLTAFIDGLERDVLPKVCPSLPIAAEGEARVQAAGDQRAAEEIERLAEERAWTTQHDNEVVSVRDLYEQVARLRGELDPVTYDFPPADRADALDPT